MSIVAGETYLVDPVLVDQLPGAAYLCGSDGAILRANARAVEIWGRQAQPQDRYTAAWRMFLPDGTQLQPEQCPAARAVRCGERVQDAELVYERQDGSRVIVLANVTPLRDASGQVAGALACLQDITSFRRSVERLYRLEARHRKLVTQSPLSIQAFWPDGRVRSVNRAWEELFGVGAAELRDYNILEDAQLERLGVMAEIRQAFAGQAVELPPVPYVPDRGRFAGQPKWCAASIYPVLDPGGHVEEVVLFHRDVTQQKAAQEALRLSEQEERTSFDLSPIGEARCEPSTGRFLRVNRKLCQITGYSQEELLERSFFDITHPEDQPATLESIAAAAAGTLRDYSVEKRYVRKDGTVIWVQVTATVLRDAAGCPLYTVAAIEDITARRRDAALLQQARDTAERAERQARFLAEAGVKLAACLDSREALSVLAQMAVPAIGDYCRVCEIDPRDRVLRQAGCAHRDAGKMALLERFGQLYHVAVENSQSVLAGVARTGVAQLVREPEQIVALGVLGTGEVPELYRRLGPTSLLAVPLASRGQVLGVMLLATTEESGRRFGPGCLEIAAELGRRAALAVDNARLYQELERASRAKDHFLAVLSHELRTPLTPVMMTVSAMETEPGIPELLRQDLAMIRRNIELETGLIDDLLDVTRIVNGKLRLQVSPTEVHPLVRTVLQICRRDIDERRLQVSLELAATQDRVPGDPARLQQVLWNLLKNAIKFTPEGGSIVIRTSNRGGEPGADAEASLVVEVADNGIGIDPEILPRIFDAFEQGERAVTRQFGGLGLGLAISRAIVDMHGGSLKATSEGKGHGATFILQLPTGARRAGGDAAHPTPAAPEVSAGAAAKPPAVRILLVEDHADTQRMLRRLLESRGYAVTTAGSVAAALQLAASAPFDVVISDIGLPDATGHDLMRQLRGLRQVPGIAISGFGMDADIRSSYDAGFAAHLTKPVDLRQLDKVIHKVVGAE